MKREKQSPARLDRLRSMLQTAIELEHSTIPPYFYAYWSVKDRDSDAASALLAVIKEEMTHMAMACNILNSVGGTVLCNFPAFIPRYPDHLPGHKHTRYKFKVGLRKLSIESIVSFLEIERPRDPNEKKRRNNHGDWDTIADFYAELTGIISTMTDADFVGRNQFNNGDKPDAPGTLFSVNSKADALRCIAEIVEQGEGLGKGSTQEECHFQRFVDLYVAMGGQGSINEEHFSAKSLKRQVDMTQYGMYMKGIRNIAPNPALYKITLKSYQEENRYFNLLYSQMLDHITEAAAKPNPDLMPAVHLMFSLGRIADTIMSIPISTESRPWRYCGPSFEYIPIADRT